MFKMLKEWFEYREWPTGETAEWYTKILDCIDRIENGETLIENKRAETRLILYVVKFINTFLGNEVLSDITDKWKLQEILDLMVALIRNMSRLTYREMLDTFPVRIPYEEGEKHFDGNDIYFDEGYSHFYSPSLDSLCLIVLCGCGIYFDEETEGTTDFDAEIGDGIMKYMANNLDHTLHLFYYIFLGVASSRYYAKS